MPAVPAVVPAFRPGSTVRTPLSGGELATLERLADRIEKNEPSWTNPERFHVEASEIRTAMRRVIGALRTGQAIPEFEDDHSRRR